MRERTRGPVQLTAPPPPPRCCCPAPAQGEEWRATRMAEAVEVWESSFLEGLQQSVRKEVQQAAQQDRAARVEMAW